MGFDSFDVPAFPSDALPSRLRHWCEEESTALQVPLDLPALLALSIVSVCIAKKVAVHVKPGWIEPVNLYVVLALGVGEGKSPAFSHAVAPLHRWESEQQAKYAPKIAAAAERRRLLEEQLKRARQAAASGKGADRAKDASQEAVELAVDLAQTSVPVAPRLVAEDATPEEVGRLLATHGGRLGIFSSEGGPLAILAGRYAQGRPNLELFCKAYSADPYTVDRVNREGLHVRAPHLTVALTVQPSVIAGVAATPEMRGQGLLARFIYSIPKSKVGHRDVDPPPTTDETRARYESIVDALLRLEGRTDAHGELETKLVELTVEAREALITFKRQLEPRLGHDGDLHSIADWANKLPGTTARLACILHAAEQADCALDLAAPISEGAMRRAIAIAEYAIEHARAAFGRMDLDPKEELARRAVGWFARCELDVVTQRDIQRGLHVGRVAEVQATIEILIERGFLRRIETLPTGGRPRGPTFEINPHARPDRVTVPGSPQSQMRLHPQPEQDGES